MKLQLLSSLFQHIKQQDALAGISNASLLQCGQNIPQDAMTSEAIRQIIDTIPLEILPQQRSFLFNTLFKNGSFDAAQEDWTSKNTQSGIYHLFLNEYLLAQEVLAALHPNFNATPFTAPKTIDKYNIHLHAIQTVLMTIRV